jgi:hypothetical protein
MVSTVTQPRKTTGRTGDDGSPSAALKEAVAKGVAVPFDRLQEALDDAVRRGRMQRRDAEELAAKLLATVGGGVQDLVGNVVRGLGGDTTTGTLPIDDYENLTAAQITQRLDGLSAAQLRRVRDHEAHHANRVSVLRAIDKRLG